MKIIMYGASGCPDCTAALSAFSADGHIELDYRDITKSLKFLKEFLSFRDHDDLFDSVKNTGGIGIPFFVAEDRRTLSVADILKDVVAAHPDSCSATDRIC